MFITKLGSQVSLALQFFENNLEGSCSPDRFSASRRSTKLLPTQTPTFWWCAMGQHHHPSASTLASWFIFPFLQATSPCFPCFNYLVYRVPVFVPTRFCSYSCRKSPNHHLSPYLYHCCSHLFQQFSIISILGPNSMHTVCKNPNLCRWNHHICPFFLSQSHIGFPPLPIFSPWNSQQSCFYPLSVVAWC